jgi:hypothetical protein
LDKEFLNLKESSGLRIKGKELIEDKFIALKKFWGRQVVEPFSGARYFGEPFKVPASDHFSIAKPIDSGAIQHRLLCRFVLENQRAVRTEPIPNVSSTAVSTETRVVAADSGFAPDVPKISIKGFSAVDEEEIDLIIDRYGTDWPEVRIAWPQASDTLISIIRNAIDRFDEEGIGLAGSEYFIKHAPSALAAVVKKRDFFQKRLSGVVRRVREFEREYIKVAVKNCLLFGNYALHRTLIYHSSWGGLPALKLRVPPAVANFHGVLTLEHAYAKLFNETDEFYHGRITEIGDQWERSLGDSNIYIFAPKRILFKSGIRITDKHTICTWFIPQFELEAPDDAALPDRYSGEWAFLVVENERNWEI